MIHAKIKAWPDFFFKGIMTHDKKAKHVPEKDLKIRK